MKVLRNLLSCFIIFCENVICDDFSKSCPKDIEIRFVVITFESGKTQQKAVDLSPETSSKTITT